MEELKAMTLGGREVRSATLGGARLFSAARYEELEYIEFDGIAYIDLRLDHVTGYEYELEFNVLSTNAIDKKLFINKDTDNSDSGYSDYWISVGVSLGRRLAFIHAGYERQVNGWGDTFQINLVLGERYHLLLKNGYLVINGDERPTNPWQGYFTDYNHAMLLGCAPGQDFLFRVRDAEGNIICDCRPARRISDGECGMYDKARGIFLPRTSERGNITGNYPTGRLFF